MGCLGYTTWRRFKDAINRAMESCKSAEIEVSDHFADAVKMVEIIYITNIIINQIKSLCKTYFQSKRKNNGLTGNKKFILRFDFLKNSVYN